jgi:hypothetical protein
MIHITVKAKGASALKLGGMAKMASAHIRREILAALMESPLYFTIPLRKRLEFLKSFSQQSAYNCTCEYLECGGRSCRIISVDSLAAADPCRENRL